MEVLPSDKKMISPFLQYTPLHLAAPKAVSLSYSKQKINYKNKNNKNIIKKNNKYKNNNIMQTYNYVNV